MAGVIEIKMEDEINKLEQVTATLGFIQTAFAEGSSLINNDDASNSLYMLWMLQRDILEEIRQILDTTK